MPKREPANRYLLVGTAPSLLQMRAVLNTVRPDPVIAGELLPDDARAPLTAVKDTKATDVLISLPLVMQKRIAALTAALDRAAVPWRFLPTLADQLAGRTQPRGLSLDEVDPSQLINRTPRQLDEDAIRDCLEDRVVLITGAGGSIGSELARCVCRFNPSKLVLVERSENALFEVSRQLDRIFPQVDRVAELHDVTQSAATRTLIERHKPQVVFHAAAHKHVPMMEDHPAQAVENNFLGTRSIADAVAEHCAGGKFVMISTDKAVNPTSVMGATKRMAELYCQHLSRTTDVTFSMVRFGNVIGSACSVLPIWTDQLRDGGPITVTHPEMTRYFMTIPEAAGLVLQAATFSKGGEVFLLDMGKPINILELAQRFIRLHGLEPDADVAIHITGPRPGEKLFEELAYGSEDMLLTPHPAIRLWRTAPPDTATMQQTISTFTRLRDPGAGGHPWHAASRDAIVTALRSAVPEMLRAVAG